MPKEKWKRPAVFILEKGKSQENVLQTCKYSGFSGPARECYGTDCPCWGDWPTKCFACAFIDMS